MVNGMKLSENDIGSLVYSQDRSFSLFILDCTYAFPQMKYQLTNRGFKCDKSIPDSRMPLICLCGSRNQKNGLTSELLDILNPSPCPRLYSLLTLLQVQIPTQLYTTHATSVYSAFPL